MRLRSLTFCARLGVLLIVTTSGRAQAQAVASCTLERGVERDLVLSDERLAFMFPEVLSLRHDTLLVLGGGVLSDSPEAPATSRRADSLVAGVLLTGPQYLTTTVIPLPAALRSARSYRVHPRAAGWDVVFFVPDAHLDSNWTRLERGTLWYASLVGGRWADTERIGHVTDAAVIRPNTSELILRDDALHFALTFGDTHRSGGLIVWHRNQNGHWSADTVTTPFAPMSVTTASEPESADAGFYVSLNSRMDEFFAADLLWVSAVKPSVSRLLRRSVTGSMNAPVVHPSGDSLLVSWWQGGVNAPRTLWFQPLARGRENASERNTLVTNDVSQFSFLAIREGSGTRMVWAYRVPDTTDSVEVAVVANGEPKVIGRMAFPFGFLTNGVASGDRSFILATSPRPKAGTEPSASHILEVRVSCSEGT